MSEHLDDFADDIEAEDFEAEGFYPFATVQQWAALNADIKEAELSVLTFVMCHLNTLTGKFDAGFGRKRVAERFGRSMDWVDKRFNNLIEAGALTKQHMFWVDGAKKARTAEQFDPKTGARRSPAPNRWRVRMSPPGGQKFSGPLNIGEFYDSKRITARLQKQGVTTPPKKSADQGKRKKTPAQGVAATERLGVAVPQRLGVAAAQRPELSSERTTTVTTTEKTPSVAHVSNAGATRELVTADGRTDGNLSPKPTPTAAPESAASVLVDAAAIRADLERIDLRASQRRALIAAVDAALLRFSDTQVARYLRAKASEAQTATWLVNAFADWSDTIADVPKPRQGNDATVLAAVEAAVETGHAIAAAKRQLEPEAEPAPKPVAVVFARPEPQPRQIPSDETRKAALAVAAEAKSRRAVGNSARKPVQKLPRRAAQRADLASPPASLEGSQRPAEPSNQDSGTTSLAG